MTGSGMTPSTDETPPFITNLLEETGKKRNGPRVVETLR